jgi:hypothetical protein
MSQLLTLSAAARLIGVRRGALQSKIRSGELATFEGMVSAEDLQRVFPQAKLEDDSGSNAWSASRTRLLRSACASACCPTPRCWPRASPR